ncbi:MAG TPA: VWA domain-containing protein [Vicinamibacterales bacterium]|nr:VWA domain-containing protein [Vicinamibacterales bacterium]
MPRLVTPLTLAIALAGWSVAAQQSQPQVYRGTAETVRVYATVTDRDGRLVTNLTKDQFEVRDDGKPQPVVVFDNSPQPIQLIVLLDVSGSMAGNLPLLRESSRALFAELGADDVARVGSFGREIVISPEFTHDATALQNALPEEIPPNAPTPLWRAVDQAMSVFDKKSDRRSVVMVLSDGRDDDRHFSMHMVTQVDVIDRARKDDVMVYAIGLRNRLPPMTGMGTAQMMAAMNGSMPDPGLARTAEETGGGYAEVTLRDDLGAAFARIVREMHSQYLLGYEPPRHDGKAHKIEVRVTGHGLEPRARKSYVAPAQARE